MTGEKNRFKTQEQLWKLEDGEISTPKHDELVLQLLNQVNYNKIVSQFGYTNEWVFMSRKGYDCSREQFETFIQKAKDEFIDSSIIDPFVKSEVPVSANNGFLIGYLDIQITIPLCIHWGVYLKPPRYIGDTKSYVLESFNAFSSCDGGVISARNIKISEDKCINSYKNIYKCINIEVKPAIKSFGETLRQINTYRVYDPDSIYVIYSPDTRFKAAFESQGVKFITPSDLGLK